MDGSFVDSPREPIIPGARLAKVSHEVFHCQTSQVFAGAYPQFVEALGRHPADAVKLLNWQLTKKPLDLIRPYDRDPVRFVVVRRHLRQKLVKGNTRRTGKCCLVKYASPDFVCDTGCGAPAMPGQMRHVQEGLVERQRLNQLCVLTKDLSDLETDGLVHLEPRLHENEFRAFARRSHGRHGRSDAEPACFVAGSRNDASPRRPTDCNGTPTQVGIVTLLYRCVERVHIYVNDPTVSA